MTHRSPPSPSPETVRRSLRALANGSAAAPTVRDAERVVADAERATACAREAVSYLVAGRLSTLDAAVESADRRGAAALARRGRRAGDTLRRLRAALTDDGSDDGDRAGESGPAAPRSESTPSRDRPARGTVLGASGQRPPR